MPMKMKRALGAISATALAIDGQGWVRLVFRDSGSGIPPEILERARNPFFTTKPVGVGTGLGLSVSYFIITENHGGSISVQPGAAGGCCFIIRLPLPKEEA